MLKKVGAFALAGALAVASVGAAYAENAQQGALAPGKAASVKQAQDLWMQPHWVWIAGVGFVLIGFGLTVTGDHAGTVGSTTTCPLSGCPVTPPPTTTTSTTTTSTH